MLRQQFEHLPTRTPVDGGQVTDFGDAFTRNDDACPIDDGLLDRTVEIVFQEQAFRSGVAYANGSANRAVVIKQGQQARHKGADPGAVHLEKTTPDKVLYGCTPGVICVDQAGLVLAEPGAGRSG
jgi:hypothetical protein